MIHTIGAHINMSTQTFASDSPDIPDTISGADIFMKETPHSRAMALASIVLPQPTHTHN